MEELIGLRLLKGFGDAANAVAIAIVHMNRHVIPLCRFAFYGIFHDYDSNDSMSTYSLSICEVRFPHLMKPMVHGIEHLYWLLGLWIVN